MATTPRAFRELRDRRRTEQLAITIPRTSRTSSAAGVQVKDWTGKLRTEEWQPSAYAHANEIGELGYFLNLISSTVAKGRLVVVETDDNGRTIEPDKNADGTPIITGDREAAERVLNAFRGPEGNQKAMLYAGTLHDQIAGEAILIGEEIQPPPGARPSPGGEGIGWELVSVLEVTQDKTTGDVQRHRSASRSVLSVIDANSPTQAVDPSTYLARYHRSDWAHSGDATSALRRNAAACREAVLWNQLIETTIRARLAAGVLLVPEEVDFSDDDDGISDVNDAGALVEQLVEHLAAPIEDPKSGASITPLVIRVASDMIDKFKLLGLTDEGALKLEAMLDARAVALRRVAGGMDGPLEIMEGVGSTNHWSGASIDMDFVKKHIVPLGERLARFFTIAYFRRMLVALEEFTEEQAERFELAYDGAEILTRMDAASSADSLYADGLMSGDARIESHGFDPDQIRPSDEEAARRLILQLVASNPSFVPLLSALDIDWAALGVDLDSVTEPDQAPAAPADTAPVEQPDAPDMPSTGEPTPADEMATIERVRTAASMVLDRALERAATRVVSQARKLPDDTREKIGRDRMRSWPGKAEVLRCLTADDWAAIKTSPAGLMAGAWDDFNTQASGWLREFYQRRGLDMLTADERARWSASELCHRLDDLAQHAFDHPLPLEDGLSVPLDMVRATLTATPVR